MSIKEAYRLLGLDYPSDIPKIKSRFHQLAKEYHPDFNEDDDANDKFHQIYEAYEAILKSFEGEEVENEKTWFYEWKKTGFINPYEDPFEVSHKHYWMPKIAKMLKFLRKENSMK